MKIRLDPANPKTWRCGNEKAIEIAEKLAETGFFERRGSKDSPNYWVPFFIEMH